MLQLKWPKPFVVEELSRHLYFILTQTARGDIKIKLEKDFVPIVSCVEDP
jgi:hypothetical protein